MKKPSGNSPAGKLSDGSYKKLAISEIKTVSQRKTWCEAHPDSENEHLTIEPPISCSCFFAFVLFSLCRWSAVSS